MEKLNKLSLPATILIASIILGGFYYMSQANKQRGIKQATEAKQDAIKECFNKATEYKLSIIKTESDFINNGGRITRADYEAIYNDEYNNCIKGKGY